MRDSYKHDVLIHIIKYYSLFPPPLLPDFVQKAQLVSFPNFVQKAQLVSFHSVSVMSAFPASTHPPAKV